MGKEKEHLRVNIEDENGNSQSILWWSGAGEETPEQGGKFDIAYSLRASTYRGQKQLTLQFEELRVVEEKPVEVRKAKVQIVDHRLKSAGSLAKIQKHTLERNLTPGIQLWAEAVDKNKGKARFEFDRADEFAIYTTPSSAIDLKKALEAVQPKKIHVFAIPPAEE